MSKIRLCSRRIYPARSWNWFLIFNFTFLIFNCFFTGCAAKRKVIQPVEKIEKFYVFSSKKDQQSHYHPSGYMGDIVDMQLSGAYIFPDKRRACLKVRYYPEGRYEWAGVYWQNPADNWGKYPGGYDLTGAKKLTFWAKGEKGGECVTTIKIGGVTGEYPDSDSFTAGPLKLSKKWKKFEIDISGRDLRYISGGLCIVVKKYDNSSGCTFYLDEIAYEGKKIKAMDIFRDKVPPEVSLNIPITSFSPDGDGKEDTIAFNISAKDNTNLKEWTFEILTAYGKVVKIFQDKGNPPARLEWNGIDDQYNERVPSGKYSCIFSATDLAGNKASTEPQSIQAGILLEIKNAEIIDDEKGLRIRFSSTLLFDSGTASLKSYAFKTLDEVGELLKVYPENKIIVEGHTDSVGSAQHNLKLSQLRAEAVSGYLIKKCDILSSRIETIGYGETRPIASNKTSSGRTQNRRVEIIILKK